MSKLRQNRPATQQLSTATPWRAPTDARVRWYGNDPAKAISGLLILGDIGAISTAAVMSYVMRHGFVPITLEVTSTTLLAILLMLNVMQLTGGYHGPILTPTAHRIAAAVRNWSAVCILLIVVGYATRLSTDFSRVWAFGWYALTFAGLIMVRAAIAGWIRRRVRSGQLTSTIAIVDLTGKGEALATRLLNQAGGCAHLLGIFLPIAEAQRRNGLSDLVDLARRRQVDEVVVVTSGQTEIDLEPILRQLGNLPMNVHICPELAPLRRAPRAVGTLYGQTVLTVHQRPLVGPKSLIKRSVDVSVALLLLLILAPLLLILSVMIKIDSRGPVLFKQKRIGYNANVITILKLRSMKHSPAPEGSCVQARQNDPRVTRLGRFLRRSSLDELPQLINVLRGDMSLVGPRPHAVDHNHLYAELIDSYLARHRVKPGITGWAQINGLRGETDTLDKMRRRIEHDLAYIDGWSLALDLKILFLTLIRGAFGNTAY